MDINYFELYELPIHFGIDMVLLKKKFYELSRRYHPDFYVNEPASIQKKNLELSTQANKAYQVLTHPVERVAYILKLFQLITVDEDKYQLSPEFLVEMMDLNELLTELEFSPDAAALEMISVQITTMEKKLSDELDQYTGAFDSESTKNREELLLQVRDIWYRQKYLLRIRHSLNKFAARSS